MPYTELTGEDNTSLRNFVGRNRSKVKVKVNKRSIISLLGISQEKMILLRWD
jgi:hypothetical protein